MYISSRDNREKTGDIAFCEAKTNILQGKSLQQQNGPKQHKKMSSKTGPHLILEASSKSAYFS